MAMEFRMRAVTAFTRTVPREHYVAMSTGSIIFCSHRLANGINES